MDFFYYIWVFFVVGFAVVVIVYSPISIIKDLINHFFKDQINRRLIYYSLKPRYKSILKDYNIYYNRLDSKNRGVFERRLAKFIGMKEFIPRGGLESITDEMKVLIGAKAIQITFGHPSVYFEHFWRILVYPDSYYSEINQRYHKGEVNSKGYIILSWKNFIEGISDRTDGVNLGIHEMAHALHIENAITNNEYDFLNSEKLEEFNFRAQREMEKINSGEKHLFRKYAGTNIHEFFAVMIENFFERPVEFKNQHTELYKVATHIMQQDPLLPNPVAHYFE